MSCLGSHRNRAVTAQGWRPGFKGKVAVDTVWGGPSPNRQHLFAWQRQQAHAFPLASFRWALTPIARARTQKAPLLQSFILGSSSIVNVQIKQRQQPDALLVYKCSIPYQAFHLIKERNSFPSLVYSLWTLLHHICVSV